MGTAAQRRRGNTARNKQYRKARKTCRSAVTRDIDQIVLNDMKPEETEKLLNQKMDEDKPGLGQHYCIPCARYFTNDFAIKTHLKTKDHKKRTRIVNEEEPYTIEESMKAAGMHVPVRPINPITGKMVGEK